MIITSSRYEHSKLAIKTSTFQKKITKAINIWDPRAIVDLNTPLDRAASKSYKMHPCTIPIEAIGL